MFCKKQYKPAIQPNMIPPIIVNCVNEFTVCGSRKDIPFWLTQKNVAYPTSFVIYDPDGSLRERYGKTFRREGYRIRTFNPASLEKSARYNPFEYINDEKDILKLVTAILTGTKGRGRQGNISFLTLESILLTALIGFINEEAPSFEHNFGTLIEMLNAMEPDKDTDCFSDYKHAVDFLFEDMAKQNPNSLYVKRYEQYKDRAYSNIKKVVKSCAARLYPFGSEEAREYFSEDELGLKSPCDPQTALFVTPEKSGAFDFIVPLMYTQLFDMLCDMNIKY